MHKILQKKPKCISTTTTTTTIKTHTQKKPQQQSLSIKKMIYTNDHTKIIAVQK